MAFYRTTGLREEEPGIAPSNTGAVRIFDEFFWELCTIYTYMDDGGIHSIRLPAKTRQSLNSSWLIPRSHAPNRLPPEGASWRTQRA